MGEKASQPVNAVKPKASKAALQAAVLRHTHVSRSRPKNSSAAHSATASAKAYRVTKLSQPHTRKYSASLSEVP